MMRFPEPRFSKGDWTREGQTCNAGNFRLLYNCGAINITVSPVEREANAVLISQAPKMYELLEKIYHKCSLDEAMKKEIEDRLLAANPVDLWD